MENICTQRKSNLFNSENCNGDSAGIRIHLYLGAGHEVNVDRPEVLADILNDFYED